MYRYGQIVKKGLPERADGERCNAACKTHGKIILSLKDIHIHMTKSKEDLH